MESLPHDNLDACSTSPLKASGLVCCRDDITQGGGKAIRLQPWYRLAPAFRPEPRPSRSGLGLLDEVEDRPHGNTYPCRDLPSA